MPSRPTSRKPLACWRLRFRFCGSPLAVSTISATVLDVLVQSRRRQEGRKTSVVEATDEAGTSASCADHRQAKSYAAAKREIMPGVEQQHKGLNNRAKNSHQPTRRRDRIMKRFKSPRQVQRFLSTHDQIANVFARCSNHDTAAKFHSARNQAFTI